MVDHLNVSYLYKKCGVYYFSKRVPNDLKSHYKTNRIVICLRTKSNISAIRSKKSILQKLDDYWTSVRITQMKIPAIHLINDNDRFKSDIKVSKEIVVEQVSDVPTNRNGFLSMEVEDILKAEEEYSQWRDRDRMWLSKLMDK